MILRALFILAALSLSLPPHDAQAASACVPFSGFPLSVNLGAGLNTGTGESVNCFGQKVQDAFAMVGQPNGMATLDNNGRLPNGQLPAIGSFSTLNLTGSGSTGDVSGMSVTLPSGSIFTLPNAIATKLDRSGAFTSLLETDAPGNLPIFTTAPQAAYRSREYSVRTAPPATRTGYAYAGRSSTLIDPGAGQNGPTTAGYGMMLSTIKQGFPAQTSGVGELDTLLLAGRQSGPVPTTDAGASDYDGIQANYQQSGDTGYLAGAEFLATRIDPTTYSQTHSLSLQIGVIDAFGKNGEQGLGRYSAVNRLSFGYAAIAGQGALDRAFYGINTASGTWADFIYLGQAGAPLFRVKGADGSIKFGPDSLSMSLSQNASTGQLNVLTQNGTIVASFYEGGTASFGGSVSGTSLSLTGSVTEQTASTPATSTAACSVGQHAWDANYEYRCVATNTWKRAALSAF